MNVSSDKLLEILDRIAGTPVLVVGDLILDHYIWGAVRRISPEAPVVVVEVREENKRPGGAGNVASNLASLGARASICGAIGSDEHGKDLLQAFENLGVDTKGIVVDPKRPTTVKTRVIAHSQQVVRIDREVTTSVDEKQSAKIIGTIESQLGSVKGIAVSDYGKGTIGGALFERVSAWKKQGTIGIKGIPVVVDPKAPNFSLYSGATVIKPNRAEAGEAAGMTIATRQDAITAGGKLLSNWNCDLVLITLGEDGMVLVSAGSKQAVEIDTVAQDVYDVSGAGDTVTAVMTAALAVGASPGESAQLANIAAGLVVAEVGTVAVQADQLREAVRTFKQ